MHTHLLAAQSCERKARECVNFSDKFTEPSERKAMLQLAAWWMRLAQYDRTVARILGPPDDIQ